MECRMVFLFFHFGEEPEVMLSLTKLFFLDFPHNIQRIHHIQVFFIFFLLQLEQPDPVPFFDQ